MEFSPYDDPEPRGWRLIVATLRAAVALQCWGYALQALQQDVASPLSAGLERDFAIPADQLHTIERGAAYGLLVIGASTLWRPFAPLLLVASAWPALLAAAAALYGSQPCRPAEDAVRVLAPLALLLVDFWPPRLRFSLPRANVALWLLRLGAAVTFVGHGLHILMQRDDGEAPFTEMIVHAAANLFEIEATTSTANIAAGVIAGIDFAFGLNLLAGRMRKVALLGGLWGAVIAFLPVAAFGPGHAWAFLQGGCQYGAPLVLFLFWWKAIRELPPLVIPGD